MIEQIFKLIKVINSESAAWQISLGFALGFCLGLLPLYTLSGLVLIFLACVIRVNIAAFLLAFAVFSGVAYIFDQQMLSLGESILTDPSLSSVWGSFYDNQLLRLAHYNHTMVMGAWVLILILVVPFFLLSQFIIKRYREHLLVWIRNTKAMKFIKANKWYQRGMKAYSVAEEVTK